MATHCRSFSNPKKLRFFTLWVNFDGAVHRYRGHDSYNSIDLLTKANFCI